MTSHPIVHFEIPADNTERAITFYKKTFGWKITDWPMPDGSIYHGVLTKDEKGQGIDGGLTKRKDKNHAFNNYVMTESIDATLKTVVHNGGKVCMPKTEIAPGMGWIAMFQDTEGNLMGLHENAVKEHKA